MKIVRIRKIVARLDRVRSKFGDEARVRRMLFRAVPNILPRDASNRANDLMRLFDDVTDMVAAIAELKAERTELRRENRVLRLQLSATIVEEDGVEVEHKPYEFWEGYETPASRED